MNILLIFFLGVLSAFAQRPTDGTVAYRQSDACHEYAACYELPKGDLYSEYILVAVNDCGLIGAVGTLTVNGERANKPVMVFDCKGPTATEWMSASNADTPFKVAAEVDYYTRKQYPHWVGSGVVAVLEFER